MKSCFIYFFLCTASLSTHAQTIKYNEEVFTLRDIVVKCEIYRYSKDYGDLECSSLRFLNRKCEVYFADKSEINHSIECAASGLQIISQRCRALMNSRRVPDYGQIICKKS